MACYLADKPPLLIEIHSLQIRFIVDENFVGLWDNPDLQSQVSRYVDRRLEGYACLGAIIFNDRSRKVLDRFPLEQYLNSQVSLVANSFLSDVLSRIQRIVKYLRDIPWSFKEE